MTRYPSLGFDPAPGDVGGCSGIADLLKNAAEALAEALDVVSGDGSGRWEGEAAESFRSKTAADMRPRLREASESFHDAGVAIAVWSADLEEMQARARRLESDAADALADAASAQQQLAAVPAAPVGPGLTDPHAAGRAQLAAAVRDAEERLRIARSTAQGLLEEHRARARVAGGSLKEATSGAPEAPNVFERLGQKIKDVGDAFGDLVYQWRELIDFVADIASALSLVAGLLAFIPPLTAIMLPIAAGLSLLAMLGHGALWGVGEGSGKDVLLDAIGVFGSLGSLAVLAKSGLAARAALGAPGMYGAVAPHTIRTVTGGTLVVSGTSLFAGHAVSGTELAWKSLGWTLNVVGSAGTYAGGKDPIDAAKGAWSWATGNGVPAGPVPRSARRHDPELNPA